MKGTFHLNTSTADSLGIGLFKCTAQDSVLTVINSTMAIMMGYSSKTELEGRSFTDLFSRADDADEFFKTVRRDGKVNFLEALFKRRDGSTGWVAITASRVAGEGAEGYIEGIIEDISSHKEMEEKLALERDLIQGLLDNIPDAIYFKDVHNRIIKVNNFYVRGTGLPLDKILGKTDFDFFPEDQAKKMFEDDNYVLSTGKPIVGKIERTLLPNGTWNQVITTKVPMYDRQGMIIGTMGITRDMTAYAHLEKDRIAMSRNAFMAMGKTLEMRDPYTFSHNNNVANISERIGKEFGWNENSLLTIRLAGELHDLGKISIPLEILNKPGKLNEPEYRLIQEHVRISYEIIKDIHFPFSLADVIFQHHERLNGSGYPRGLKDDQILLGARILAVSDVLDAMTSHRPYRESMGLEKAVEELADGRGSRYDPQIVDMLFKLINEHHGEPFWTES